MKLVLRFLKFLGAYKVATPSPLREENQDGQKARGSEEEEPNERGKKGGEEGKG